MYSNKENINILTSLLVAHGVTHAVVCPGSRNAPIVHNLNESPDITCYPVTDERSAGFYALGMAQSLRRPVAVCVTSGTALLNLLPAVAEAFYQRIPLIAVSADRPPQWIGQLDGQTLPQPDALGRFVLKAVTLPEPGNDEERWQCNRLVNEALILRHGPVHINVPISEPLFEFTVESLPQERRIELHTADISPATLSHITHMFFAARKPMLVSGQPLNANLDEAVMMIDGDERYVPDFVLYIGGSIVSKRLKRFLRQARETWVVNETGEVADTFMNLTHVFQGDPEAVEDHFRFMMMTEEHPFIRLWDELLARIRHHRDLYEPAFSQMAAVRLLEQRVGASPVQYANSSAIRLGNIYASINHLVYCNRGVNGIEGSLSTAAGFSLVADEQKVYCVIGDLSFFYDQNALWNRTLREGRGSASLRILLLNNGCGGIFNTLPGLEKSPAREQFVAAAHFTTAEGICRQNEVAYFSVNHPSQLQEGIDLLMRVESDRPVLLEVFTTPAEDERALRDYYHYICSNT